jgi:DNA repair exonuclease SbcCD ATPase subunit
MQGGMGGNKEAVISSPELKKEIESLKKEISVLLEKKKNIQVEINNAVAEELKKLTEAFEKKKADLDIDYEHRLNAIKVREDTVKSDKEYTKSEFVRLADERKKLDDDISEFTKKSSDANSLYIQALEIRNKNEAYFSQETKKIADITVKIEKADALLTERQKALDAKEIKLKEEEEKLHVLGKELVKAQSDIKAEKNNLEREEARIKELSNNAILKVTEATTLKEQAQIEYDKAKEAHARAVEEEQGTLADINKEKERQAKLSANLEELQKNLIEKEKSIKEREKVLALKDKEIDLKIATLKKLRGEA